jgi:hypothetical protein
MLYVGKTGCSEAVLEGVLQPARSISIIETGKQNGRDPYAYLHYFFTKAPLITDKARWEELLLRNLDAERVATAVLAVLR